MTGKKLCKLLSLALLLALFPLVAAGATAWSQPVKVSGGSYQLQDTRLWVRPDGRQAAFWKQKTTASTLHSLWASVRPPGQGWTEPSNLSGPMDRTYLADRYLSTGLAPDGTAWALWSQPDDGQAGDNMQVWVAWLPPGGSWQKTTLTGGYEGGIRSSQLAIGPEGDLAAVWVACAAGSAGYDPPCHVNVRRKPAGAVSWLAAEWADDAIITPKGMQESYVLVGPASLTVVIWAEANPADATHEEWRVAARAFVRGIGWDAAVTDVSNGWIKPEGPYWLPPPVMDGGGTGVVVWKAKSSAIVRAFYSATRIPNGPWNLATQISTAYAGGVLGEPHLVVGQNGTVMAAWEWKTFGAEYVHASVRDPGVPWGQQKPVSGYVDKIYMDDLHIWPDGTAVVLWHIQNQSSPLGETDSLYWSARLPYLNWGDEGLAGQIGPNVENIGNAGLALGGGETAAVVWTQQDTSQPANQQHSVLASLRPSQGSWSAPQVLVEKADYAWVMRAGVSAACPGDHVGAVFEVRDSDSGQFAVWHSGLEAVETHQTYLPLLLKSD